ncbi:hypothetical protein Egran_02983, partial [Elaphomyces granulatus]
ATSTKERFPRTTVSCGKSWNFSRIGRWRRRRGIPKPAVNYTTRSN